MLDDLFLCVMAMHHLNTGNGRRKLSVSVRVGDLAALPHVPRHFHCASLLLAVDEEKAFRQSEYDGNETAVTSVTLQLSNTSVTRHQCSAEGTHSMFSSPVQVCSPLCFSPVMDRLEWKKLILWTGVN